VFFQDIQVVGKENTPKTGALILCGNHSNQFIDPSLIISNLNRPVSYIIAASVSPI